MSIAPGWVQSGYFTPNYNNTKKEVTFLNNDTTSMLKKIAFIEKTGLWGSKSYSFVVNLNYTDSNKWIKEAPDVVNFLNDGGGKASFSYINTGQILIEVDSANTVGRMLDTMDYLFTNNTLPTFLKDSIINYALPSNLSIFDHAYKGNISEIENMLKNGKKVHEKDANGQDLLHIAYLKQNKKLAETALKWGASIDSKDNAGKTILYLSVEAGDYDWYKFASNKYASKLVKDANLNNLLHTAVKAYKGLLEITKKSTGTYSLDNSGLKQKGQDYKQIIKDLARNKDLIKQANKQGDTPVSIAAEARGDKSVFDDMIRDIKYEYGAHDFLAKTIWEGSAWADML